MPVDHDARRHRRHHRPIPAGSPACLVTALITERGLCPATPAALRQLFPDR